ncbi:MAG: hypothetical protein IPO27_00055 [Bacteroidetes bacterium]|nr:hypothetical protein [Bacteroidota bacterium]
MKLKLYRTMHTPHKHILHLTFTRLLLLYLAFNLCSCGNQPAVEDATSSIPVTTTANSHLSDSVYKITSPTSAAHSYYSYIPSSLGTMPYPVILFFDPHGDGSLPLHKYKEVANQFGFAMLGSNNSMNGNDWNTTNKLVRIMLTDAFSIFNVDSTKLFAAGFSGGAKVACYAAYNYPLIKGVIANSALLTPKEVKSDLSRTKFIGLAGDADMNYIDVMSGINQLRNQQVPAHLIVYHGKHEWCDVNQFAQVVYGLYLYSFDKDEQASQSDFITGFRAMMDSCIAAEHDDILYKVMHLGTAYNFLQQLDTDKRYESQLAALYASSEYKAAVAQGQQELNIEMEMKNKISSLFQSGNFGQLANEYGQIKKLQQSKDKASIMYERVLGYMSLAAYSISKNLLEQKAPQAKEAIDLYKTVDSQNAEAWFFSAKYHAQNKETDKAISELNMALQFGLVDTMRIHTDADLKEIPR